MHQARTPAEATLLAHGELFLWLTAVQLQRDRALGAHQQVPLSQLSDQTALGITTTSYTQADVALFAIALRNLIRAAEWLAIHEPSAQPAIKKYHGREPNSVDIRDFLEHFDDYIEGRGKLQHAGPKKRRGKPRLRQYVVFMEATGNSRILHIGDWTLDIALPAEAATQLVEDTLNACESP